MQQGFEATFDKLGLSKSEGITLYKAFRKIDDDNSGQVSIAELMAFLDVERTPFTERAFRLFDEDHSTRVCVALCFQPR